MKHIFRAQGGVFGRYWMAVVDGKLRCTHMHKTIRSAIRCGEHWQKFQDKVASFKPATPQNKDVK